MKQLLLGLFTCLLFCSCITDPYLLKDKGEDKYYLSDMIGDLENRGYISPRPAIIIDSVIYRPDVELKEAPLSISRKDIHTLIVISKAKNEMLKKLEVEPYNGAIVITTNPQTDD